MLREGIAYMALVSLAVFGLGAGGVHYPRWSWWFLVFSQWSGADGASVTTPTSPSERALASFFWFAVATSATGLGWLTGGVLRSLGTAAPSDQVLVCAAGVFFLTAGFRALYCLVRVEGSATWPGLHRREIYAWNAAMFLLIVVCALADPAGEGFWILELMFSWSLRAPFRVTREGIAKRRALHEAPNPPDPSNG